MVINGHRLLAALSVLWKASRDCILSKPFQELHRACLPLYFGLQSSSGSQPALLALLEAKHLD